MTGPEKLLPPMYHRNGMRLQLLSVRGMPSIEAIFCTLPADERPQTLDSLLQATHIVGLCDSDRDALYECLVYKEDGDVWLCNTGARRIISINNVALPISRLSMLHSSDMLQIGLTLWQVQEGVLATEPATARRGMTPSPALLPGRMARASGERRVADWDALTAVANESAPTLASLAERAMRGRPHDFFNEPEVTQLMRREATDLATVQVTEPIVDPDFLGRLEPSVSTSNRSGEAELSELHEEYLIVLENPNRIVAGFRQSNIKPQIIGQEDEFEQLLSPATLCDSVYDLIEPQPAINEIGKTLLDDPRNPDNLVQYEILRNETPTQIMNLFGPIQVEPRHISRELSRALFTDIDQTLPLPEILCQQHHGVSLDSVIQLDSLTKSTTYSRSTIDQKHQNPEQGATDSTESREHTHE